MLYYGYGIGNVTDIDTDNVTKIPLRMNILEKKGRLYL